MGVIHTFKASHDHTTSQTHNEVSSSSKSLSNIEHSTAIQYQDIAKHDVGPRRILRERNVGSYSQAGEITAVPNPTPDTGLRPTHERVVDSINNPPGLTSPRIHPTPTEHRLPSTGQPSLKPPSGTTLWLLATPTSGNYVTFDALASTPANITTEGTSPTLASSLQGPMTKPKLALPLAAILSIAIAGLCLLLVALFGTYWFRPPKRRRLPKPSLPRFENSCVEDERDAHNQESPLFGPNERFSQRSGINSTWSWVTYPQTKSTRDELTGKAENTDKNMPHLHSYSSPQLPVRVAQCYRKSSSIYPLSDHTDIPSAPVNLLPVNGSHSLREVQTSISGTSNRMSTSSNAYVNDTSCTTMKEPTSIYTGDGYEASKRRSRTLRKSKSNSIYETRRRTLRLSTGTGLAYDCADINSPIPAMEYMPLSSPGLGDGNKTTKTVNRTRIRSPYYAPGSYPRISSSIPTTLGVATRVKFGEGGSLKNVTSPMFKSEGQRARETKALTRALGLESPVMDGPVSSPQPTLYPDDSLSIVESKRLLNQRSQKAHAYKNTSENTLAYQYLGEEYQYQQLVVSTPSVVAIASGSLMSAEDLKALTTGSSSSTGLALSWTAPTLINSKSFGLKSAGSTMKAQPKPPRVPSSPPQLPSLAQMAMEHKSPEGYADYRSPTYSIYNLYDDAGGRR